MAAKTLLHNSPRGRGFYDVTIYESQQRVGGLWPTTKDDANLAGIPPFMVANQSRHTVQFSDFAWDQEDPVFPPAWMVGRYLERYAQRYAISNIKFNHRIRRAELVDGRQWVVTAHSSADGTETTARYDYLLVASGFFGPPAVDPALVPDGLPWSHSSSYRSLKNLLGGKAGECHGGKILVVGGQMSGVEVAAAIAAHISSETHSQTPSFLSTPNKYTVHHVIQRPIWVFPLFTSPMVRA